MAARSRKRCEATLARADGVVAHKSHQRSLRGIFPNVASTSNESDVAAKAAHLLSRGAAADAIQDDVWATPSLASLASPPHEGEISVFDSAGFNVPLVRETAADGRGSLTSKLAGLGNSP